MDDGQAMIELELDAIVVKNMIRKDLGDLGTLENSIRRLGLLFPVIVNRGNVLLSGRRRLEACRSVGMKKIPALVLDVAEDSMKALDIQCQENYCRKELTMRELEAEIDLKKAILLRGRKTSAAGPLAGLWDWLAAKFRRGAAQPAQGAR